MNHCNQKLYGELFQAQIALPSQTREAALEASDRLTLEVDLLKTEVQVIVKRLRAYQRAIGEKFGVPLPKGTQGRQPQTYLVSRGGAPAFKSTPYELRGHLGLTMTHIKNMLKGLHGLAEKFPEDPTKWSITGNGISVSLPPPPATGRCEKHQVEWNSGLPPGSTDEPGCPKCAEEKV